MRRAWYWSLLAVESAGMVYIFSEGIPFYRRLLGGSAEDLPGSYLRAPMVLAVLVMQVSYWGRRRIRPSPPARPRPVLALVLLFVARLSFIFAGSSVTLILFVRSADTRFSPVGLIILLAVVFAQFCYARELETLSRGLEES